MSDQALDMLYMCRGCRCNAVCAHKDELMELNKKQCVELPESLAKIIRYEIKYTCACRIRDKKGKENL